MDKGAFSVIIAGQRQQAEKMGRTGSEAYRSSSSSSSSSSLFRLETCRCIIG
jgi:hypothetical protein